MSEDAGRANSKPEQLDRVSGLWRRANEHKIVQWTIAYVALAYALQHGVILTAESLEWPSIVARVTMLLLALGLPLVMVLAWYHGHRASRHVSKVEFSIISLLLVVGSLWFYVFVRPSEEAAVAHAPPVQQAGVNAARNAAADPHSAISVAVLPFVNLSSDKEQEFFSDGMTEEITAALAKVPDLRVVARTSAFEFKGKNVNIKTMGEQLGATHLIEGSVRKAGNRLRITAQLIKSDDGTHIWAEDYDRELNDVFAIQEDIARAITASLRMPLGLKPGQNLVNNRAIDLESYEKFLRAKVLVDGRGGFQDYAQAQSIMEEVVAKNPDYAPAWVELGAAYFLVANTHAVNFDETLAESRAQVDGLRLKGEVAARKAIQLDPGLAEAHDILAVLTWSRAKPLEADELFVKALGLDPFDAYVLDGYDIRIGAAGRAKEALANAEKARSVEPFLPPMLQRHTDFLWVNGRNEEAIALAKTLRPSDRAPKLAMVYASMGRYTEAADALKEIEGDTDSGAAEAARLLLTAPKKTTAPEKLPRLPRQFEFVYLHIGAPERAIATYERMAEVGYLQGNSQAFVWHPSYAPVRKTERFKTLMRKVGLVEYWKVKGWPPQCHPTTGDDFACE